MATNNLRAGNDIQIETVLTEIRSMRRIKVPIETDEPMPINMGQVIFEFKSDLLMAPTKTQCKNIVDNFVKRLK